jgi:hypothetical protein
VVAVTLEEVKAAVEDVRLSADDDECAHVKEDNLYRAVLEHHAKNGCHLAAAALVTQAFAFARWCA